jgi:flagellar protein FliS
MFMAQRQFAAAQARYRAVEVSSRIEGASPHGLVVIMYEEALKALDAMAAAARRGDRVQRGQKQVRALNILHGLDSSLDHKRGGAIAADLSAVYREARRLVLSAGRDNDVEKVVQARAMLGEIASAWEEIGARV